MAEDEASTSTEDDADECLHCAIVDMVDERIAAGGADAANLAALIAESLADVILRVPEEEQAKLMAHWRLWATSFCRRAAPTKAAPDRHPIDLMSPFCSHAKTSSFVSSQRSGWKQQLPSSMRTSTPSMHRPSNCSIPRCPASRPPWGAESCSPPRTRPRPLESAAACQDGERESFVRT